MPTYVGTMTQTLAYDLCFLIDTTSKFIHGKMDSPATTNGMAIFSFGCSKNFMEVTDCQVNGADPRLVILFYDHLYDMDFCFLHCNAETRIHCHSYGSF